MGSCSVRRRSNRDSRAALRSSIRNAGGSTCCASAQDEDSWKHASAPAKIDVNVLTDHAIPDSTLQDKSTCPRLNRLFVFQPFSPFKPRFQVENSFLKQLTAPQKTARSVTIVRRLLRSSPATEPEALAEIPRTSSLRASRISVSRVGKGMEMALAEFFFVLSLRCLARSKNDDR